MQFEVGDRREFDSQVGTGSAGVAEPGTPEPYYLCMETCSIPGCRLPCLNRNRDQERHCRDPHRVEPLDVEPVRHLMVSGGDLQGTMLCGDLQDNILCQIFNTEKDAM